jgi:proton-translocating NADH-quinone oxidoreductase chain M
MQGILLMLIILPLFLSILVGILPRRKTILIRKVVLSGMFMIFNFSLLLWSFFDNGTTHFQYVKNYTLFLGHNVDFTLGVDGISIFFVLLTTFLMPLCILSSYKKISNFEKEYFICFLVMESLLLAVFTVLDVFLFYIFFESILIPMFLVIVIWGSRERKIRAGYLLFMYTVIGSLFMLFGILDLYTIYGTTNYLILLKTNFPEEYQCLIWIAFFISFAVKVPMMPFHIWLPEAHVEAPTSGSVLLAGLLLKLGTYGILRFLIPLFPYATIYYTPFVYTLASTAVIYTSLTAIRQIDIKRIIAYASVAHMNLVLLGLFSLTTQGVEGAILQSISHGFVSSALFLCVGVLYDRHHSRLLEYYGGLATVMPVFAVIFLFFSLANIAFPLTSSFVGELLILAGVFESNTFAAVLGSTGMVLGTIYSLWVYNRISYGQLKEIYIISFKDVDRQEFVVFFPLILATLVVGIYPELILKSLHMSVECFLCQVMN